MGRNAAFPCSPSDYSALIDHGPLEEIGVQYTDKQGKLVFAHVTTLRRLGFPVDQLATGEDLPAVLGVNADEAAPLLAVQQADAVAHLVIMVTESADEHHFLLCTATPSLHSETGSYLGLTLMVSQMRRAHISQFGEWVTLPAAVFSEPIPEAEELFPHGDALMDYFAALMTAVRVLLGRYAGTAVLEDMVAEVDALADRNGWPVRLHADAYTLPDPAQEVDAYRTLLLDAIDYTSSFTGKRVVSLAVREAHDALAENIIGAAQNSGLYEAVQAVL